MNKNLGYPENQARRQESSSGDFYQPPQKQGQGLGSQAFKDFIQLMFENEEIPVFLNSLWVKSNSKSICNKKEGFEIVQMVETPIRKYIMKKRADSRLTL